MKPLYVITAISNPKRFKSRYALYRDFEKRIKDAGGILYTVEHALGDRPFEVTVANNPQHVQVRSTDMVWVKENLLNIGAARLPSDWEYVCFLDADVLFAKPNWVEEIVHALQHFAVIQPFSHCMDIGPNHELLTGKAGETLPSMAYQYVHHGDSTWGDWKVIYTGHQGHCGYSTAWRRDAFEAVGGLIDWSILGSGDHLLMRGLFGNIQRAINPNMSKEFKHAADQWQERAKALKMNVGYIDGLLIHNFHGPKSRRGYLDRWQILVKSQYNPYEDIKRTSEGVITLVGNKPWLRDKIRLYFSSRSEDDIRID